MQKPLAILAIFLFSSYLSIAQDTEKSKPKKTGIEKPSRDFFMVQLTYDGWVRPDSIKTTGIGRGLNIYLCYDWPIGKSNFSFAAGIGIGSSNIYLDDQVISTTDTGALGSQARFLPDSMGYKRYKLNTAYLEAPFELRFFSNKNNRNKGFKAAIGLRAGTLIGAHTKGVRTVEGTKTIDKTNTKRYLEKWRLSATARVGWGNLMLMGSYNLNTLYKADLGPEITPYSIGICITGL
jgi:hypothetical protein